MSNVQRDFQTRVAEIEEFFKFVEQIDIGRSMIINKSDQLPTYSEAARNNLLRTFRASSLLLLYNLMESSVTNAVEAIFDEMSCQGIHFNDCRQEVRLIVLKNLKQHNPDEILPMLNQLATDIVTKTFKKSNIVSGNVDARLIRKISQEYGMQHPSADGKDLVIVKASRNDLAHGTKSFAEVGRDFSISDIIRIKTKVIEYLSAMLASVDDYIDNQRYRNNGLSR